MRSPAVRSIPAVILLALAVVSTAGLPLGNTLWAKALGVVGTIRVKERHHGCTPGFWKQGRHLEYWPTRNGPNQLFSVAFLTSKGRDLTLLEALKLRGGDDEALMRQAVAALLNAGNQEMDYRYSTADVLEMFKQAVDPDSLEAVKDSYETANRDGCPYGPPIVETALDAEQMAYASRLRSITFDWALAANADPPTLEMEPGSNKTVHVGLAAQRFQAETKDEYLAEGLICLTNTGQGATQGLAVDVVVQAIGDDNNLSDLAGLTLDVSDKPALDPGEYYCYFYAIPFVPGPSAPYRTVAQVWIDNYLDHSDGPYGPELVTVFGLPSQPDMIETDAESELRFELICPLGFACDIGDPGPWLLADSRAVDLDVELTANDPTCATHAVNLSASLQETDTGQLRTAETGLVIQAVGCPGVDDVQVSSTPTPTQMETGLPTEEPTLTP
jgi:hypothetical protein